MYKKETQLAFEDFVFPFGELDSENDWVKLAGLIPWDTVERAYAKQFVDNGHPAHSARIALGALIITSWAFLFMGKGMISRMELSPASSITMRSTPGAIPAWGGAP